MIVTRTLTRDLLEHLGWIDAMYGIISHNMRAIFGDEDAGSRAQWYENCVAGIARNPDWKTVLALDGAQLCGYFQYGRQGAQCIWGEIEIAPARQGDGTTLRALLLAFLDDPDFAGYDTVSGYINDKNRKSQGVFRHLGLVRGEAAGNGASYTGQRRDVERWARRGAMTTELLSASNPADIQRAADLLRAGELVAIPTETVYGLAANALDPAAVEKIFIAKGRPQDNPLIVHVAEAAQALPLVKEFPFTAQRLAAAFWPGPLTVILPRAGHVPAIVSAGLSTLALRVPAHPAAQAVLRACGLPLAAPSANRSGRPSPTLASHALDDLRGRIAAVLDAGPCTIGVESTVIDLTRETPLLLRPGGIPPGKLKTLLGRIEISRAVTQPLEEEERAASPGLKYKHYAPRAELTLVQGPLAAFLEYAKREGADGLLCFDEDEIATNLPLLRYGPAQNPALQAGQLFARLREVDARGLRKVMVRCPAPEGVGLAVYNRLLRAAAFRRVELTEVGGP